MASTGATGSSGASILTLSVWILVSNWLNQDVPSWLVNMGWLGLIVGIILCIIAVCIAVGIALAD
jgi:hypothetical protein